MTVALVSKRIVTAERVREGAVLIEGEHIAGVVTCDAVPAGATVEDLGDRVVMPALVDTHVHVNEPGRTEWEGFETATEAAAAGGVGTVVDMPLNCTPVTTTVAALRTKLASLEGKLSVDVGFWGGVVPEHLDELPALAREGILGAKAFLIDSGIDDFRPVGEKELRVAMGHLASAGLPLLAHAEIDLGDTTRAGGDPRAYSTYLRSRPPEWEDEAIRLLISLSRETGCRVHVVHLSAASAVPMLRDAKSTGVPITVETCPHYLCLEAERIPVGATIFKCAPPIREHRNREALWDALREGVIDMIVSDHSPCTPALKCFDTGDFEEAWGGISSLSLTLALVWTEARARGFGLQDMVRWLSVTPAALAGLAGRKGSLNVGADADIVVWNPDETFTVETAALRTRHRISPYVGCKLFGRIDRTLLCGSNTTTRPSGRPVLRGHAAPNLRHDS